jgi:uncharacterized RDD family membrane protein YckC
MPGMDDSTAFVQGHDPIGLAPGRVAGFWVRLLADLFDAVFLFCVGGLLSVPFHAAFIQMGERGIFVGLALSLLYTGVLQSRFGGGRTLGKKILGLKVVRPDGTLLSLDRSLVRYGLMGLLVYQGAVSYAVVAVLPFLRLEWLQTVLGGVAVALFLGCVLVVPFHPLKRGLHDLLAGTIVIRGPMPDAAFIAARMNHRRDRGILIAMAALVALAIGVSATLMAKLPALAGSKYGPAISRELEKIDVANPVVSVVVLPHGDGSSGALVVAAGFIPRSAGGGEPAWNDRHRAIVKVIKENVPPDFAIDRVGTALRTGFNIGIYRSYETVVCIDDARTGATVQTSQRHDW